MNATLEQALLSKIRTLTPQQVAEVEDFVEFLAAKSRKNAAIDRLLAIAPALEAAGVPPLSEEEIASEIQASRPERRARQAAQERAAAAQRLTDSLQRLDALNLPPLSEDEDAVADEVQAARRERQQR